MKRLRFDVFGEIMIAERGPDGWTLLRVGSDGKRSPAGVPIPAFVSEDEIADYLDGLFHESATPGRPRVLRIADD